MSAEEAGAGSRAELAAGHIAGLVALAAPGARLGTKEGLRAECGVSVGTFNETLRLLRSRGLITVRPGPGGGLFAAEQSPMVRLGNTMLALDSAPTDVADVLRIRDALDPLVVSDALSHASPADITGFRERVEAMAEALAAEDPVAFKRANWRLHARIAEVSPNPLLRSLYLSLLEVVESHTRAVLPVDERPVSRYLRQRLKLHADLVEAIARRDHVAAARIIKAHRTTGRHAG